MTESPKISIVIPALNEAEYLSETLRHVATDRNAEVIVVDGGSTDNTRSLALAAGVPVLSTSPGRAGQQNLGAVAASGEILFFLHADTLPPTDYALLIRRALKTPGVSAGAFSLALPGTSPGFRAIARIANLRSKWLQLPYGDQGLFLYAPLFHQLGGFPTQPIMEDFAFIRQLRHHGRIITLPQTVLTSHRRWRRLGLCRTTFINQLMIYGYYLGVAPATLARMYQHATSSGKTGFAKTCGLR